MCFLTTKMNENRFLNLRSTEQSLELYRMLYTNSKRVEALLEKMNHVEEENVKQVKTLCRLDTSLTSIEAMTIKFSNDLTKLHAVNELFHDNLSLPIGDFQESDLINFEDLPAYVQRHVNPICKEFMKVTTYFKELIDLVKKLDQEFSENNEMQYEREFIDDMKRLKVLLTYLNLRLRKGHSIDGNEAKSIRREWSSFLTAVWKKSNIFHPDAPLSKCIVKDANIDAVVDFISEYLFIFIFNGVKEVGDVKVINPEGTVQTNGSLHSTFICYLC